MPFQHSVPVQDPACHPLDLGLRSGPQGVEQGLTMWRRLATLKSDTVPLRQIPALGFQTAILRPTTSRPAYWATAAFCNPSNSSKRSGDTCLRAIREF